jgi:hypothetical protein
MTGKHGPGLKPNADAAKTLFEVRASTPSKKVHHHKPCLISSTIEPVKLPVITENHRNLKSSPPSPLELVRTGHGHQIRQHGCTSTALPIPQSLYSSISTKDPNVMESPTAIDDPVIPRRSFPQSDTEPFIDITGYMGWHITSRTEEEDVIFKIAE